MAEAAVTIFLENISQLEMYHADLISGAEKDLQLLKNDLALLKAFLRDEARKPKEERGMEREIKEVVYEVEDTIEACLTKASVTKTKNLLRYLGKGHISLEREVKSLRQGVVKELLEKVTDYNSIMKVSDATSTGVPQLRTRPTTEKTIKNDKVVGLEDEEEIITGYLMEQNEKLDVISIIGSAGRGKTTLARKIYESERIANEFPILIWTHVSRNSKYKDVYLSILKRFTGEDMSILNEEMLCESISACLEEDRFLLVVDNLRSSEDWQAIKRVLPSGINGVNGKVLITSRDDYVGEDANINTKPHTLRPLGIEESWELLKLEVFGNSQDCRQELVEIGRDIAEKCGGLPLLILAVAGLLGDQLAINGWKKVSENVNGKTGLSNVMELTYSMLPDDLRDCFLYMGVFPEDCEISVSTLTRLWIAEGFIQPREGESSEEIASKILDHLITRKLVKADKVKFNGEVKTCRLHDMIREICVIKSKEQNLFQEITGSEATGALEPPASEVQNSRLCVRSDLSKYLSEKNPNGPLVRSLLCFHEQPVELEPRYVSVIQDGFPKLRILEAKSIKLDQFPAKAPKLIHLRYLTLYIETLIILPEPITHLWNLQSLVVETKSRSIKMKANMWRMIRLRYFKTKASIVLENKLEGEAGQNLHTLNSLAPESCTEAVSRRAKNLKTLGISGKLAPIFETDFLEKLHHLEKLKLVSSLTYEPTSEDLLQFRLPERNCFPPHLKRLSLVNTFLGWQHMSTLAMIKSLEALKLKSNAFVGVSWNLGTDSFPNLQFLLIFNADLVLWEASADAFPKLRFLVVKNCENLKEIPECLGTQLEKLEIERLRNSAVESARMIEGTKKAKQQGKSGLPFTLKIGPV